MAQVGLIRVSQEFRIETKVQRAKWNRTLKLKGVWVLGGQGWWQHGNFCVSRSYTGVRLESCKRMWLAERTDEQKREKLKYEDTQLGRKTKRDKNRQEDRHPGKSEKEKGTGYQEHRELECST